MQPDNIQTQKVADLAVSLIRTWVPIGMGALLAWIAASQHLPAVPAGASATAGAVAAGLCAGGYYALARALESVTGAGLPARAGRGLGRVMLGGVVRTPTYPAAVGSDAA